MSASIELALRVEGGRQQLCCPAVGFFTQARRAGEVLGEGERCGTLLVLGVAHELRVPAGAAGRIARAPSERVHAPLGYGDVVYELEPIAASAPGAARVVAAKETHGLVLRSPQTGRFYHRPGPKDSPFVEAGALVSEGTPVGLIEVMKTFTHVVHRASGGLPATAKFARYLVRDGADVAQGEPLLELEAP